MTVAQALITICLVFTRSLDLVIFICVLLGLTGGRQAFAYLYLTDIVPMTHISFVSMWFSGSLAIGVLVQCAYFFWIPYWRYYLIFNICFGLLLTFFGACLLVESPMYYLLKGDLLKASESLEFIKKFNNLGGMRKIDLFQLN